MFGLQNNSILNLFLNQDAYKYNKEHNIVPRTVKSQLHESLHWQGQSAKDIEMSVIKEDAEDYDVEQVLEELEHEMLEAAEALEFERAADLRDQINLLKNKNKLK